MSIAFFNFSFIAVNINTNYSLDIIEKRADVETDIETDPPWKSADKYLQFR